MDDLIEELAALDAAGAIADEEAARLEAELARADEPLRDRVGRLHDAAAAIAIAIAPPVVPSSGLREDILTRVHAVVAADTARQFSFALGDGGSWHSMGVPGAFARVLAKGGTYSMVLVKGKPGTRFPPHHHRGHEECYVVSGDLFSQGRRFFAGDFLHAESGSEHDETSTLGGCLLVIVAAAPAAGADVRPGDVHA